MREIQEKPQNTKKTNILSFFAIKCPNWIIPKRFFSSNFEFSTVTFALQVSCTLKRSPKVGNTFLLNA